MKWFVRLLALAALAGGGYWGWLKFGEKKESKQPVKYRTAKVVRTDVVRTVEATGTVQPVKKVEVGAQVNGKIIKLMVDYNSVVTNGQVVALIDPQVYEANYKNALAQLHSRQADVKRWEAQLTLAEKTLKRKEELVKREMAPVADYDSALEARDSASASLDAARANVEQSEAQVSQARANLNYCTIVSPVNGKVINRSVDEGQTVVSSMNAVPLLNIAMDLRRIQVEATVPEADVGQIRVGQSVTFTADAYRRKFTGKVREIRLAATTLNNVVTYPIIIEAENPDEMLFPGMTANISVETARADDVPAVTSAAFRFRPKLKEGEKPAELPAGRKVWVLKEGGEIEPVGVETGISDESFTEVKAPADLEGKEVVLGYERSAAAETGKGAATNPFMPKPPKRNTNRGTAPAPKK